MAKVVKAVVEVEVEVEVEKEVEEPASIVMSLTGLQTCQLCRLICALCFSRSLFLKQANREEAPSV